MEVQRSLTSVLMLGRKKNVAACFCFTSRKGAQEEVVLWRGERS